MGEENDMSNNEQAQMPQYQCHKKVWALKIAKIKKSEPDEPNVAGCKSWELIPENTEFSAITVTHDFYCKHKLSIGGYYVVYPDGYESFSPASAFEEGYTLLG